MSRFLLLISSNLFWMFAAVAPPSSLQAQISGGGTPVTPAAFTPNGAQFCAQGSSACVITDAQGNLQSTTQMTTNCGGTCSTEFAFVSISGTTKNSVSYLTVGASSVPNNWMLPIGTGGTILIPGFNTDTGLTAGHAVQLGAVTNSVSALLVDSGSAPVVQGTIPSKLSNVTCAGLCAPVVVVSSTQTGLSANQSGTPASTVTATGGTLYEVHGVLTGTHVSTSTCTQNILYSYTDDGGNTTQAYIFGTALNQNTLSPATVGGGVGGIWLGSTQTLTVGLSGVSGGANCASGTLNMAIWITRIL